MSIMANLLDKMYNLRGKHRKSPPKSQQLPKPKISHWQPSYLRRPVLIIFVAAFCGIIAALETLNHLSQAHNGIASSVESRHYLWTYGPTAILTVVAAFWSRVEFQVKERAPWKSMAEKPEDAKLNILLDYISEMQPVSMVKAVRNKHFDVAAGVTCSMLLRLLIVFSTGLFALQEVQVNKKSIPIQLQYSFGDDDVTLNAPGSQPFDILNGVLFENGTYPDGTNANLAFQRFTAPSVDPDAIVTAPVDGMVADLGCETATINVKYWDVTNVLSGYGHYSRNWETEINELITPSCTISNVSLDASLGGVTPYVAKFTPGQCDNSSAADGMRIVVSLADISLGNLTRNTSMVTGTNITTGLVLNRSVQMICKPTYSLVKLRAKSNASDSSAPVILERIGSENFSFANLTAWDIAESVLSGSSSDMSSSRPIRDYNPYYADNDPFQNKTDVDAALQVGARLAGITGNINQLFEDGALQDVASSYYRAMAAQLMNKGLTQQNRTTIIGQAIVNEDRVILLQLPLRVMEVCLILGILLAAAMIFLNPQDVIAPWKPTSISSTAAIMANSATLRRALSGTGSAPLDAVHDSLKERRCHSEYTPGGFVIETESDGPGSLDGQQSHQPAWSPFPNFIVRGAIFFAVALVIAALEIVLHISQQNDGLGDVSTNQFQHYLWTIIPSLVMVSIGLLFGSIDFNTRSLAPYELLKRPAGAVFNQFMTTSYLDSLATTNIFRSIRAKQFAVMATTLAALITSFLTIITSGLYSVIEVPLQVSMSFTQETTFYTGKSATAGAFSTTQDPAIIIAEYIIQENLTYPRWTYDELVFPEITMNTPLSENDTKSSFVDIRVPALRAAPACHFQTGAQLQRNFTKAPWGNDTTYQFKFLAPEMPCSLTDEDMGSTYSTTPSLVVLKTEGLFGKSGIVSCGNGTYSANPATWYMWGKLESGSVESVSAMTCIGAAETVDTLTRFQLPDFDITDEHPPVPDESSAVSASNVDVPWISWMIDGTTDVAAEYSNLDGFFIALVLGRYAIPAENLADPNESDKIIKAIKHQDSILKAQLFNNFTRTATNGTLDDSPLLGNITMSNRLRLLQDAASTRVLEALLASMLVLGILGSILMNTDRVLPKNPSSIAAVASLLADSNALVHYERVMGDPNEPSLGQAFFARCRFFLGFKEDGPHQGDPWQLSNAEYDKKYCIYFSKWESEKIPSDHFDMTGESGHKRTTRVEERFI